MRSALSTYLREIRRGAEPRELFTRVDLERPAEALGENGYVNLRCLREYVEYTVAQYECPLRLYSKILVQINPRQF